MSDKLSSQNESDPIFERNTKYLYEKTNYIEDMRSTQNFNSKLINEKEDKNNCPDQRSLND